MSDLNEGIIVILSSPSGAGKTTLVKKISSEKNFSISISHTTRKPRSYEKNGSHYFFVSNEKFQELIYNDKFLEYAKVFNNFYGTTRTPVINNLNKGKNVLFDIDWQGTQQLKKIENLSLVTFFILPPDINVLKKRLLNRHQGQEKLIEKRMNKFNEEVSHWKEYNYVVVNDNLEICYNNILKIMISEINGKSIKQNIIDIEKRIKKLIV